MGQHAPGGEFFEHRVVSQLGLVRAVKEQSSALRAMRVGTNPGVLVGESPGLNRGAAWILETYPNHALVDVRLALEIFGLGLRLGLRPANLRTKRRQVP